MHFSTVAALAVGFASAVFAIPAEATEASEAAAAAAEYRHYDGTYIINVAGGTYMDLYNGNASVGVPIYG